MTPTGRVGRAVVVGTLAAALAACGSGGDGGEPTNGLDELPAEQIERRAAEAAHEARSVQLSGTVLTDGRSYRLDVRLTAEGAVGEVATEGTTFELLRIGEDLYLRASAEFWESEGIPAELESDPTEKLDGKYVRVPPEDPAYGELSGFTEKNAVLDLLLSLGEGERETGGEDEVEGHRTIRVQADGGRGGAMDVSLTGRPYPLRLERAGGAGELIMTDWNEEFTLNPPPEDDIVDYGDDVITGGDDGGDG